MNAETGMYAFLFIIFIALLGLIVIVSDFAGEKDAQAECFEKGCKENSLYIGSKSKKEYFSCSCNINVNKTDLICFENEEQALSKEYKLKTC